MREAVFYQKCAPVTSYEESRRRLVVKLVYCVYFLLIFEGVLRKWIFPQFSKPLFFVRDPFVIWIYLAVLGGRIKLAKSTLLFTGVLFGAGCLVILMFHAAFSDDPPLYLALYGWRNYFFYLPLAFVIQRYLYIGELKLIARYTLLIAIPLALLTVIQISSPATAPINAGLSDEPTESFVDPSSLLAGGLVRPAATFTSNLGFTAFIASAFAINMAAWLSRSRDILSKRWLLISTFAIVVCLALSGSRGAILWSGSVVVIGIVGLLAANRGMGVRALIIAAIVVVIGTISMPLVFPQPTAAFVSRWTEADQTEAQNYGRGGIFARALDEIIRFRILIDGTPTFGYGLGSAGNAAWHLGNRETIIPFATDEEIGAAETDWGRNILELGPIVGSLLIGFRIVFFVYLGGFALRATKLSSTPLPWLLFAFVALQISYGQITAHGSINGYTWLFIGFCLSASDQGMGLSRVSRFLLPNWGDVALVRECV